MRGDIGEDFALRIEQYGGQHRPHHIRKGAGNPDAGKSVQAGIGKQHGYNVGKRQQENELSREAGDDGNPGFIDGLEEVGIDDGEADEREHHHQEAHGGSADADEFGVGGEDFHHGDGENAGDNASNQSDKDADFHGEHIDMLESVGVAGPVIVAGYGLHALADAENEHDHQAAEGVHNAVGAHRKVAAVAQQLSVQQGHYEGGAHIHQERAHADEGDVSENVTFRFPTMSLETDERGGLDEMGDGHHGGEGHGNGGGPRRTGNA